MREGTEVLQFFLCFWLPPIASRMGAPVQESFEAMQRMPVHARDPDLTPVAILPGGLPPATCAHQAGDTFCMHQTLESVYSDCKSARFGVSSRTACGDIKQSAAKWPDGQHGLVLCAVLPDEQRGMYNYVQATFDSDPTADHERLSGLSASQRLKVAGALPATAAWCSQVVCSGSFAGRCTTAWSYACPVVCMHAPSQAGPGRASAL